MKLAAISGTKIMDGRASMAAGAALPDGAAGARAVAEQRVSCHRRCLAATRGRGMGACRNWDVVCRHDMRGVDGRQLNVATSCNMRIRTASLAGQTPLSSPVMLRLLHQLTDC